VILHFTGMRWADAMSLTVAHVEISARHVVIFPPGTKADQHATVWGTCPMHLPARPGDNLCPVAALRDLPAGEGSALFALPDGTPPDKEHFTRALATWITATDRTLDACRFTWHSFRIGAATDLAVAGAPLHVIKRLLRWRSDSSAEIYMRMEADTYAQWMDVLAGSRPPSARHHDGPPAIAFPVAVATIAHASAMEP